MALTEEEKKQHQLEAQRRYRAKLYAKIGRYSDAQMRAQYKYLNKIRDMKGEKPIVPRKTKNIDF